MQSATKTEIHVVPPSAPSSQWPTEIEALLGEADRRGAFDGHVRQDPTKAIGVDTAGERLHAGTTDLRLQQRVGSVSQDVVENATNRGTLTTDVDRFQAIALHRDDRVQSITGAELPNAIEKEGKAAEKRDQARVRLRSLEWRPDLSPFSRMLLTVLTPVAEGFFSGLTAWYMGWDYSVSAVFGLVMTLVFAVSQFAIGHLFGTLRPSKKTLRNVVITGVVLIVAAVVWINVDRELTIKSDNGSISSLSQDLSFAAEPSTSSQAPNLETTPPVAWMLPFGLLAAFTGLLAAGLFAAGLEERELKDDLLAAEREYEEDKQDRKALQHELRELRDDKRAGIDELHDRRNDAVRAGHELDRLAAEPDRLALEEAHLKTALDALRTDAYQKTDKARENGGTWLAFVLPGRWRRGGIDLSNGEV
ncbi:MAG: hypothetical protein ACRDKI_03890 [Solirubrobacterales bacterium]